MATIDNAPLVSVPSSSGRLFDLFEMPQAVSQLLAGCSRWVDAPAVAILVPTSLTSLTSPIFISHLPHSYRSRRYVFLSCVQPLLLAVCRCHFFNHCLILFSLFYLQTPTPDQERFFHAPAACTVASADARWTRTLLAHPWAEVRRLLPVALCMSGPTKFRALQISCCFVVFECLSFLE